MRYLLVLLILVPALCRADVVDIQVDNDFFLASAAFIKNNNYGDCSGSPLGVGASYRYVAGWSRSFFLDSLPALFTVEACTVFCYTAVSSGSATVGAYLVFKPIIYSGASCGATASGETSREDWYATDSSWTTNYCNNADDGGSYNRNNGSGADRMATSDDDVTYASATSQYNGWAIDGQYVIDTHSGSRDDLGIIFISSSGEMNFVDDSWPDEGTSYPTFIRIYYTEVISTAVSKELRGGKGANDKAYRK